MYRSVYYIHMIPGTAERINITLPRALAKRLRKKGNVSAFIARSVEARLEAEAQLRAAEALAAAYRAAAKERTEDDWDTLAADGL